MTPGELTVDWLSATLGQPVLDVAHERVGTGLVGMNVRCTLTYAAGVTADAPRTVVAKLPSPDETSRATGRAMRNYEREVLAYQELLPWSRIRRPHCHHAAWDRDTGAFVLLLEDLAPAAQGDQITGCTPEQARTAVTEAARLHAPFWDDPDLADVEWLQRRGPADAARVQALYQALWPGFVERFGHCLTTEQRSAAERAGAQLAHLVLQGTDALTLTHGDYRLDNMMFATPEGGYPLAVVDWQTPGHGPGIADVSYFLGAGLTVPLRRRYERDLVDAYVQELEAEGVVGIDRRELWEQYRLSSWGGVVMAVIASMVVGRTDRGDRMFEAMATRHLQHALDVHALDFVGP